MAIVMIQLHSLTCLEEINEASASEEPYVLLTSVDQHPAAAGLPPVPNFEVFRYGVFNDMDAGETVDGGDPAFWGPSSTPQDIAQPDQVALVVSLLENDNGVPEQYQWLLRTIVTPAALLSTAGEPNPAQRAARLTGAVRDALNGVDLPVPFALDDDHIGTRQLVLDGSDLLDSGSRDKLLRIESAEGRYDLVFRITAFQPSWRFCHKCKVLYFDGDPDNKGACPAEGVQPGHEAAGLVFGLMHDVPPRPNLQPEWRFCSKCMTLFFNGDPGNKGVCKAGGNHEAIGFNFALLNDVPPPVNHQPEWRFCGKCMSLFFNGEPSKGVCPRPAPSSHEAIGLNFFLPFDSPGANLQPEWRFCGKCMTLFFNGDPGNKGVCPNGGVHEAIGLNFFLPFDSPGANLQPEWRFCGKCMTLFFNGDPGNKGVCPKGGVHDAIGLNFFLPFDSPGANRQPEWRFCGKCLSLFFNGDPHKGVCPKPAPSSHEPIGAEFVLTHF
ncbi:hypothetical protein [Streptomyces sp. CB03911]|uniref:hypothetical protein n=1 Tax=Streptomyces sp. CB03911 TaxID=1804758 RepID=UPI0018FEA47D|nr:hypothetical protein [Streptomyces sp. CB03911]